jgi:hypothetical protein
MYLTLYIGAINDLLIIPANPPEIKLFKYLYFVGLLYDFYG